VQRFDSAAQLRTDAALDDPTLALIRDEFFERNRRDANARGFYALNYAADVQEVDRQLWLLLQVPDSLASVLLVLDPGGTMRRRVVFSAIPGATGFAVDRAARRIVLASQSNATLASAPLPRGLLP
jgi:hypothetical protein